MAVAEGVVEAADHPAPLARILAVEESVETVVEVGNGPVHIAAADGDEVAGKPVAAGEVVRADLRPGSGFRFDGPGGPFGEFAVFRSRRGDDHGGGEIGFEAQVARPDFEDARHFHRVELARRERGVALLQFKGVQQQLRRAAGGDDETGGMGGPLRRFQGNVGRDAARIVIGQRQLPQIGRVAEALD